MFHTKANTQFQALVAVPEQQLPVLFVSQTHSKRLLCLL